MFFMKKILAVFAALLIPVQVFAGSDVMYKCSNPPIPGPCMHCNKSGCYATHGERPRCGGETRLCKGDKPFEMLTPEMLKPMEEFKVSIINLLGKTNDELFARLGTSLATGETAKAKAESGSQTQNAAPAFFAEEYLKSVNKLDGIAFPCGNLAGYALNKSMSIIDQMNSFLAADDRDYAYGLTVNSRWNLDDAMVLLNSLKDSDSFDPISGTFSKQEAAALLDAYQAAFQIPVVGNLPDSAKGQGVDTYLAGIGRVAFTRQMMGESFRRYVLMRTGMIPYGIAKDFLTGWFLYAKKNANQTTVADAGTSGTSFGNVMIAETEKKDLPLLRTSGARSAGMATKASFGDDIGEPTAIHADYDPDVGLKIMKTTSSSTTTSSGTVDWAKVLGADYPYLRKSEKSYLNCCGWIAVDGNGNVTPGQHIGVLNKDKIGGYGSPLEKTKRNAPVWKMVQEIAEEIGLDPEVLGTLVGIESSGGTTGNTENSSTAYGAMQLTRDTARSTWGGPALRVTPGNGPGPLDKDDERKDTRKNIAKGAAYYKHIRDEFYSGKRKDMSNTGDIGAFGGYNWSPKGASLWLVKGSFMNYEKKPPKIVTTIPHEAYCYTCKGFKYPYAALRELYASGGPEYIPVPITNSLPETVQKAPEEKKTIRGDPMERTDGKSTLGTPDEQVGPVTEADMEEIKKSGNYTMVDVGIPAVGSSGLPSRKLSLTPHEITQEDLNRMNELIPATGDDELISRNTLFEMMLEMYSSQVYQDIMTSVPEEVVVTELMKLKSVMVQLYNDTRKAAEQNSILWSMVLALASQDAMMDEVRSFNNNFKTVSSRQE